MITKTETVYQPELTLGQYNFLRKWAEALRSGDYSQHRNGICSDKDNTFCCLAVLGHMMGGKPEDIQMVFPPLSSPRLKKDGTIDPGRTTWSCIQPPQAYYDMVGMDELEQATRERLSLDEKLDTGSNIFMIMNDTMEKTFAEIADEIDATLDNALVDN